jgi:hypothetical protein
LKAPVLPAQFGESFRIAERGRVGQRGFDFLGADESGR